MRGDIHVSVVIVTKGEARNLPRCLSALSRFDDIWVVDSMSQDDSRIIAQSYGAHFIEFSWNGQYPKKRQWCLDTLCLKHDFVFFVDADEEVTPDLCAEMERMDYTCDGYFVKGAYVMDGRVLSYGLKNNKLCLIDRTKMCFPVINDLDVEGMGEIEGHYQPVLIENAAHKIGQLHHALLHHAYEDHDRYIKRHEGYRVWEEGVVGRCGGHAETLAQRRFLKSMFASLPRRDVIAFLHSYILLGGFMDGRQGFEHARRRYDYYTRRRA